MKTLFAGKLPKLAMFDLDGTLVDSVPDLAAAVNQMLWQLGRSPVALSTVATWVGNGAEVLVRRALAGSIEYAEVDESLVRDGLPLFLQAYGQSHSLTRLYPGVLVFLNALRERGVPMALITNKPEAFVAPLLGQVGLDGFFSWIIGGGATKPKPDPAGLLYVLQMARVDAAQAVFIGDSRNDVLAAKAAGVPSIAVSYGYNHGQPIEQEAPDRVVANLADLLP